MDQFSYVMALVSIIVGLGITHLLSATGAAIHRLRGHGRPVRLDLVYVLWMTRIFLSLIAFWWWEFKLQQLPYSWSFGTYLFVIGYAVIKYLTAVVLVPDQMEGVDDSYDYFLKDRFWFFGLMLAAVAMDLGDTWLKGESWFLRPSYLIMLVLFSVSYLVGMVTVRRRWQVAIAAFNLSIVVLYFFSQMEILGHW